MRFHTTRTTLLTVESVLVVDYSS